MNRRCDYGDCQRPAAYTLHVVAPAGLVELRPVCAVHVATLTQETASTDPRLRVGVTPDLPWWREGADTVRVAAELPTGSLVWVRNGPKSYVATYGGPTRHPYNFLAIDQKYGTTCHVDRAAIIGWLPAEDTASRQPLPYCVGALSADRWLTPIQLDHVSQQIPA